MSEGKQGNRWDYVIYTDGACLGNPGPGGWGVVIINARDKSRTEKAGHSLSATNNRMELKAAIEGLRATPPGSRVLLRSDSRLLVDTINQGWKKNANIELWQELDSERAKREVEFQWVAGHSDDLGNARAHELASKAALEAKKLVQSGLVAAERSAGDTASTETQRLVETKAENELLSEIKALLGENETISRCRACGRLFVGSKLANDDAYCSLLTCQLARRKAK